MIRDKNQGTIDDEEKCQKLAEQFRCHHKRLLIREITCKDNPLKIKKKLSNLIIIIF